VQRKISISLDSRLIENIDSLVKQGKTKKRSQVIEQIIKEFFKEQTIKQAVILAGGEKPNFNKSDFNQNLRTIINEGVEEIYIITNLNEWDWLKQHQKNVNLHIIKEKTPLGTAGALKLVEKELSQRFFVILADISFNIDLHKIIISHIGSNSTATIGITTTEKRLSTDTIIMEGTKIKKFAYGVPPKEKSFLTNSGVYLLEKEIFKLIPKKGSLENDVFSKLATRESLNGFLFSGKWRHMGYG